MREPRHNRVASVPRYALADAVDLFTVPIACSISGARPIIARHTPLGKLSSARALYRSAVPLRRMRPRRYLRASGRAEELAELEPRSPIDRGRDGEGAAGEVTQDGVSPHSVDRVMRPGIRRADFQA